MLDIEFHPDIVKEIKFSYQWYQNKTDGLGQDYLSELESSFQTIREFPNTWPRFQKGFRRFLLSKFPFSVIYQSNQSTVFIVAVMHNSRKPGYWNERIQ